MVDDPDIVVFSRPTPTADRVAFGIGGAFGVALLLWMWGLSGFSLDLLDNMNATMAGLLVAWVVGTVSLLAVAFRRGTITVTIDRKARSLSEVAKVGPFRAVDKTVAFKALGQPLLHDERGARFVVEVPVKDKIGIKIGTFRTRAEAEAVLQTVIAALDVEEPLSEPVSPQALGALKGAALLPQGPGTLGI